MGVTGALAAFDTAVGWSWSLTIDGMTFTEISQVDGVKLEADVVEWKTNTIAGLYIHRKLPGRMKSGQITLTRGAIGADGGKYFTDWIESVWQGQMTTARRNAVIKIHGYTIPVSPPLASFTAYRCWPTAIEYGAFKAGDNNVMTEKVTLHHEGLYVGSNPTFPY